MRNELSERVRQYIEQSQLLAPGSRCLVAVSGGADSVCLLLVLQRLGYAVEAVHCNFKLRGDESDRDERFVKELCEQRNICLHLTHFDTKSYASLHKVSIEMAARSLRYAYFEQLRADMGALAICVAHHQDDVAETVLMNLLRGTGIHGLTGIRPRNGHVVRPLLCVSRSDIEEWLHDERQPYVTDSSNLIDDVVRNKLRLNVIPQLRRINPAAVDNILRTARRVEEAARVYDAAMGSLLETIVAEGAVQIDQLRSLPSSESLLFEWLSPYGFKPAAIDDIHRHLSKARSGVRWLTDTHLLAMWRGMLLLSPRRPERPTLQLPETGTYRYDEEELFRLSLIDGQHIDRARESCSLDAIKVRFPLTVRTVHSGDRFQPFGMRGTKRVSDYLTDLKMPLADKQRQLVMTDAHDEIVWLVGLRPDGRFCVSPETQQTLFISHERR